MSGEHDGPIRGLVKAAPALAAFWALVLLAVAVGCRLAGGGA